MGGGLRIRPVFDTDAPTLAALLNEIIPAEEPTALEQTFTPAALNEAMLTGPDVYCCFVTEDAGGGLVGSRHSSGRITCRTKSHAEGDGIPAFPICRVAPAARPERDGLASALDFASRAG